MNHNNGVNPTNEVGGGEGGGLLRHFGPCHCCRGKFLSKVNGQVGILNQDTCIQRVMIIGACVFRTTRAILLLEISSPPSPRPLLTPFYLSHRRLEL